MSEHEDEVFQSDSRQGEQPAPALSQDTPSQPNQPKQDLVDTFIAYIIKYSTRLTLKVNKNTCS
jgi:hypothetical protein